MLTPQIVQSETYGVNGQSVNGYYIYLQDQTGVYNASTNTGGYGTPNPNYTDIVKTIIGVTPVTTGVVTYTTLDGGTTPTAQDFANPNTVTYLAVTSVMTGQSVTQEAITDAEYKIGYYPCFEDYSSAAIDADWTNGSTSVVLSGNTPPSFTDVTFITDTDGNVYGIESYDAVTYTFTLSSPYIGTTGTYSNCFTGYSSVIYIVSINTTLVPCAMNALVNFVRSNCSCKKELLYIANYDYISLKGISAAVGSGQYNTAQNAITDLTNYCTLPNVCNCK